MLDTHMLVLRAVQLAEGRKRRVLRRTDVHRQDIAWVTSAGDYVDPICYGSHTSLEINISGRFDVVYVASVPLEEGGRVRLQRLWNTSPISRAPDRQRRP